MKKSVSDDLIAASDALEHLTKLYENEKLTFTEKVDVGARLRAVAKMVELLDELIKADIAKQLKGKAGTALGEMFKAERLFVPANRLDGLLLKADHPTIHAQYTVDSSYYRVSYGPR